MDDIATHLGIAKKTIYKCFENKNALVESFIAHETASNRDNCQMLKSAYDDPIITLFFTMVYARKFYVKLNPAIVCALERDFGSAYLILKQHKNDFLLNAIKHIIQRGIRLHLFQKDFNEEVMSRFFLESLTIIADSAIFSPGQISMTDHEDIIGSMISGIATPSGLDKISCYKSQHRFTSFTQTFAQPYWED